VSRQAKLADEYSRARPRLTRIAYSVLGSTAEAEDVVSDSWLRLVAADTRDPIDDVEAWSTVAVARRALDVLRSARVRRETYVGPWLPEPLVESLPASSAETDPADRVTLDESVSFALLVVLESLTPAERTAWVLHDLFGMPFAEVAEVVGRSPAAVRQLAARARGHVEAHAPRVAVRPREHSDVVKAFARASGTGDLAALLAVLDPDVVLTSDGGGQVSAARRPVRGADRVARFLLGITAKAEPNRTVVAAAVNGAPGLVVLGDGRASAVVSLTAAGGRIVRVDLVVAPEKLAGVRPPRVDLPGSR
jgi:RNA polymerase sigma-70 factor (ECF subfamily)